MRVGDLVVFDLEVYKPPTHLSERARRAVMIITRLPLKGSKLKIGHVYDGISEFPTFMMYLRRVPE